MFYSFADIVHHTAVCYRCHKAMLPNAPANNPNAVPPGTTPREPNGMHRLLTRGEAATLVGMVLAVFSLLLVWERITTPAQISPTAALFADFKPITHTGFHTQARNPVLLGAFVSGALLLLNPAPRSRLPLVFLSGLCGLLVLAAALRWLSLAGFAFLPGAILGVIGGALLTFGAVDRFSADSGA